MPRWLATVPEKVRREITNNNLSRAWIAGLVMLPVHFAHVLLFYFRVVQPEEESWRWGIIQSHLLAAAFWIPALPVLRFFMNRRERWIGPAHFLIFAAVIGYVFLGAVVCAVDQQVAPAPMAYFVAVIGVAILLRLPPVETLVIFAAGLIFVWMAVGITQTNPTYRLFVRVNCITASGVGLIVGASLWYYEVRTVEQRLQIEEQNSALETLAVRDPLTGLFNRRRFLEALDLEIARIRRTGQGGAILWLDLDDFKAINDKFGHPAGDAVLLHVAAILTGCVRVTDTVARFGGEEFIVLLPDTDQKGALETACRILNTLRETTVMFRGAELSVTASCGAAAIEIIPPDPAGATIQKADTALYRAKKTGKNRVEHSFS
jgi:diguanylate cyclase (GGDEF)-like protein